MVGAWANTSGSQIESGNLGKRTTMIATPSTIAAMVEEGWAVLRDGRRDSKDDLPSPSPEEAERRSIDPLRERLRREPPESELHRLLAEAIARHEGGAADAEVDRWVDRSILEVVPDDLRQRLEQEVLRRLAPVRQRMRPEVWEATLTRALCERLRREWALPRVAG